MLKKVVGQSLAIRILENSLKNNTVSQAYLFHGPEGCGKIFTAYIFAMAINCFSKNERKPCGTCISCRKFLQFSHPDIMFLFPIPNFEMTSNGEIKSQANQTEYQKYIQAKIDHPWNDYKFTGNTEIRIDQIRMIQQKLITTPYEAEKKVIVIENIEKMNNQAANAFLKTLEEPSENTVIIMTTKTINSLLPTIISRCQRIEFHPIKSTKIEIYLRHVLSLDPVKAKLISRLSNSNLEKAIVIAKDSNFENLEQTTKFFQILLVRDDQAFLAWQEHVITQSGKNNSILIEIINSMILFLNDIKAFQLCQDDIVNINQVKLISQFYEQNPYLLESLDQIFYFLEDLQGALKGHVNPKLVFGYIYNRLGTYFTNMRK
ncbi:MAG TPA: DNA polymerase III subunit delta' [Candidatus Cloacimonadota bacterium]|nr:DNA polymerase III subunit delta' [Candidatus Cloacimonadota bacterium]HPK40339.1 DNA polymerase III subunit delta' [Candidatus Cloacimonadota bacterium]